jgi:diphthine-ammonia ligase
MDIIATWSGGKDSCLAAYKAKQAGNHITAIANTISQDYRRVRFHGVKAEIIQAQAIAMGIPLLQKETTPENYEEEFKENLLQGITKDTEGVVFGDIHLEDCLAWANKVAKSVRLVAMEPLWHMPQEHILEDFISAGFLSVIVSTQANIMGKEWVGRPIDKRFIEDIKRLPGVDMCGENGEYHSLVIDGPIFSQRIEITKAEPVLRDGYWFYDIQEYQLSPSAADLSDA